MRGVEGPHGTQGLGMGGRARVGVPQGVGPCVAQHPPRREAGVAARSQHRGGETVPHAAVCLSQCLQACGAGRAYDQPFTMDAEALRDGRGGGVGQPAQQPQGIKSGVVESCRIAGEAMSRLIWAIHAIHAIDAVRGGGASMRRGRAGRGRIALCVASPGDVAMAVRKVRGDVEVGTMRGDQRRPVGGRCPPSSIACCAEGRSQREETAPREIAAVSPVVCRLCRVEGVHRAPCGPRQHRGGHEGRGAVV